MSILRILKKVFQRVFKKGNLHHNDLNTKIIRFFLLPYYFFFVFWVGEKNDDRI